MVWLGCSGACWPEGGKTREQQTGDERPGGPAADHGGLLPLPGQQATPGRVSRPDIHLPDSDSNTELPSES
jgi:hypothetical protein